MFSNFDFWMVATQFPTLPLLVWMIVICLILCHVLWWLWKDPIVPACQSVLRFSCLGVRLALRGVRNPPIKYFCSQLRHLTPAFWLIQYSSLHVRLPNRVSHFILSGNFKLPFLCEFSMDLPETWFMGSPICILIACNNFLCKIYLLQFHVFGSVPGQTALLAAKGNRIAWSFACTYLYTCFRCSRLIIEFIEHPSEWQLLHWATLQM